MSNSANNKHVRHIPLRTCIGCRTVRPKQELIRVVRATDGVEIDISGKTSSRGAYLCKSAECWQKGLDKNRLERALRTKIADDNKRDLVKTAVELNALKGELTSGDL